jgi:beta-lactamase class D
MARVMASFIFLFLCLGVVSAEENFLVIDGATGETMSELGCHLDVRLTPCSTFKIVLSLMGYDAQILQDQETPRWDYQEGYVDYIESWKAAQTPRSWMKNSCVWYSQLLAVELGLQRMESYLGLFDYGNQDMSGGITRAWLSSSLKISPREQTEFIQKMVQGDLVISSYALKMTKELLFIEELPGNWKLFGKTGLGLIGREKLGWFVGWIEKDRSFFPFAYNLLEQKIEVAQRIPRVKQLLAESNVMSGILY